MPREAKPKREGAGKGRRWLGGAQARAIERRERELKTMRLADLMREHPEWSNARLAEELDVAQSTVTRWARQVRASWQAHTQWAFGDMVGQELATLARDEADLRRAMLRATEDKDDDRVARLYDRVLKIHERRARITGIDARDRAQLDLWQLQQVLRAVVQVLNAKIRDPQLREEIATALLEMRLQEVEAWAKQHAKAPLTIEATGETSS
jgi:hypothetical protein